MNHVVLHTVVVLYFTCNNSFLMYVDLVETKKDCCLVILLDDAVEFLQRKVVLKRSGLVWKNRKQKFLIRENFLVGFD